MDTPPELEPPPSHRLLSLGRVLVLCPLLVPMAMALPPICLLPLQLLQPSPQLLPLLGSDQDPSGVYRLGYSVPTHHLPDLPVLATCSLSQHGMGQLTHPMSLSVADLVPYLAWHLVQ